MGNRTEIITARAARRLLLHGLGLLDDLACGTGDGAVMRAVERLGFVQLDSINVVERAHHHVLWTRLHEYRPAMLLGLLSQGLVFEHWTHDASVIPAALFPHWRHRFTRVESWSWSQWLHQRLGKQRDRILAEVLERVRREGPLMSKDFEHDGHKSGPWWDWKPAKAALEYWWRAGELAVVRRVNFHKVYDLTERVLPRVHALPAPTLEEHVDWACRTALERLNVATTREIAGFWGAITAPQASAWCAAAVKHGKLAAVGIQATDGSAREGFAWVDWRERGERVGGASQRAGSPGALRLLSPFDPLVRDRARCLRLFGFDYRFEAFVPEAKRTYGYYVLPILEGDKLVGRLDPKFDRASGVLRVRRVWWEAGVTPSRARRGALDEALTRYAEFVGATRWELDVVPTRTPARSSTR